MKLRKDSCYYVPLQKIRFICEQDGIPERELKTQLRRLFMGDKRIVRAYLVRIAFGSSDEYLVALCLRVCSGNKSKRVKKISTVFAKMFGTRQHLEIMFLNDETERDVAGVSSPFYVRDSGGQ